MTYLEEMKNRMEDQAVSAMERQAKVNPDTWLNHGEAPGISIRWNTQEQKMQKILRGTQQGIDGKTYFLTTGVIASY